jgi:succinate dehydrogenase / fumarate reductase, membrane anchor subunit
MTTTTHPTPAARTVRAVKPFPAARNNFERALWIFMRYSGLALVFFAISHFGLQHLLVGTHNLKVADTELRWGLTGQPVTIEQIAWRVYYLILLILAMGHGLNGFRQVAYDYLHARGLYRGTLLAAGALIGVMTILGTVALFMGASPLKR